MAYKKFSTTKATALAAAASASATTIEVVDGSSYPDPALGGNGPYTLLLAYGSDREEIVTVTAKPSANTLTVTRGQDGSAATTKNIGDIVVHGVSKRDWEDMQTAVDMLSSQLAAKAPLASPALTGTPTAPTAAAGTSTTQLATTEFVTAADNLKANLASPTFTGDPKAPTPAAGDNDTSIATTAFVQQQVPIGTIAMWGAAAAPTGWHLCDGSAHGSLALQAVIGSASTPDLRDRFVVGAGASYAGGATGGAATVALTEAQMPSHRHAMTILRQTTFAGSGNTEPIAGTDQNSGYVGPHHTDYTGGGQAHENRPPYYALTFIIKKA